jgi:hypothetical protein
MDYRFFAIMSHLQKTHFHSIPGIFAGIGQRIPPLG